MTDRRSTDTIGDLLTSSRQRHFVGRKSEVELFRSALDAAELPYLVLYVHGPGGIGKTSLLEVFADLAVGAGTAVAQLDGRDVASSPTALLDSVRAVLDVPDDGGPIAAPLGRTVLLIDTYERLEPLDEWVRSELLPRLPVTVLTVIGGRTPPSPAWRADPAWRDLLRVISLRNFAPEDSRALLRRRGVDSTLHDRLLEISHGHPMALALFADVVAHDAGDVVDPLTPDLVRVLLRQFVDAVPSSLHRRALEASALARVTTEALLRDALELDDAHQLFGWLAGLSFIESGPDGVFPHDLARDVLDRDLRWRDPQAYNRVFHRVRTHIHRRLRSARGREQQRALFDEKFVFRNLRSILSPVDWDAWGWHYPEPARPDDSPTIVDLVRSAEGDESAAIAQRWLDRQPGSFFVSRDDGVVRGVLALLDLTAASSDDLAADPGARAAWDYAQRQAPPRPGEMVTQTRFVIDAEAYQHPSPTLNATPILTIQRYLQTPNLAWDFLTLFEPEPWDDYFNVAGLPRAVGADFVVEGRRYGLFCHDFRQVPVDRWLEVVTEQALAQDPTPPPLESPQTLALSQAEFADAVRQALRDLHRPELLARNPLMRTRLVHDRTGHDGSDAFMLDAVIRQAVEALRTHPRDDKLLRAVERTYVHPTRTQEAAAAALGLPFSTYRRHLTTGVHRIISWLWEREIYGHGEHN